MFPRHRHHLQALVLASLVCLSTGTSYAAEKASFINDWHWEGTAAPLLLALETGLFENAGIELEISPGEGSLDAIPKVAEGKYDFGAADINALIKWRAEHPDNELRAVFVLYNTPPFAVIGLRSRGVTGPNDLEGHTLGASPKDAAFAQWPAFASINGLENDAITIEDVSFAEREAKLAAGDVDAITGYSYTSVVNLLAEDVPAEDISLMLMCDFGLDLYGNAIIVNPEFADAHPELVNGFVQALTRGLQKTLEHPAAAIEHVVVHNPDADSDAELKRLVMAIGHNIRTDEVMENGLGAVDNARLARSITQLDELYDFSDEPDVTEVFDARFLPPLAERRVPESAVVPPPTRKEPEAADAEAKATGTEAEAIDAEATSAEPQVTDVEPEADGEKSKTDDAEPVVGGEEPGEDDKNPDADGSN
ncbi:MAG: ABC transporter substrate-binding protein [Gammaproteobacteria bacterium]|nr:MAG: ABC transporter substrate-binding protein [Gammaproteobacteria bacterium]